jgi:hypothetical protein
MFKEGPDATLDKGSSSLPGADTHLTTSSSLRLDKVTQPNPVRVGYRSFDRQWILPDSRVLDRPRRDLWSARIPGQVFVVEMHSKPVRDGPGLVFSGLIPDFDYFKGSAGGRTLPYLNPDGTPNIAPGLTSALSTRLGRDVTDADVLAYIAGIVAHPAYTRTFADELTTPGIRVPFTADAARWAQAIKLGEQVYLAPHVRGCLHRTRSARRRHTPARWDSRQPLSTKAITSMPASISYDASRSVLAVGDGEFAPVRPEVVEYTVGTGMSSSRGLTIARRTLAAEGCQPWTAFTQRGGTLIGPPRLSTCLPSSLAWWSLNPSKPTCLGRSLPVIC